MTQRVAKVESLIQQIVAGALTELMGPDAAYVTVTRVDAAPDLHNAIVWIGLLGEGEVQDRVWSQVVQRSADLQQQLSAQMTTKYVPRLHLRRDTGGEYAAQIEQLLKGL